MFLSYWIIVVLLIALFAWKRKTASPYNIKWGVAYLLYTLWLQGMYNFQESSDGFVEYLWSIFLGPLVAYLVFPYCLKLIGNWRIVKWIDSIIDSIYQSVKEKC